MTDGGGIEIEDGGGICKIVVDDGDGIEVVDGDGIGEIIVIDRGGIEVGDGGGIGEIVVIDGGGIGEIVVNDRDGIEVVDRCGNGDRAAEENEPDDDDALAQSVEDDVPTLNRTLSFGEATPVTEEGGKGNTPLLTLTCLAEELHTVGKE
ncbi:hypothetical protein V6N11_031649 [Hibiscus sabdariffa]|uniref:Uncharacterized protein n=1 Tax=Hibiscus sabdariffa TaxID=183260 RepID=A0ABR2SZ18_9ROSI